MLDHGRSAPFGRPGRRGQGRRSDVSSSACGPTVVTSRPVPGLHRAGHHHAHTAGSEPLAKIADPALHRQMVDLAKRHDSHLPMTWLPDLRCSRSPRAAVEGLGVEDPAISVSLAAVGLEVALTWVVVEVLHHGLVGVELNLVVATASGFVLGQGEELCAYSSPGATGSTATLSRS